jgi:hypothetical protein
MIRKRFTSSALAMAKTAARVSGPNISVPLRVDQLLHHEISAGGDDLQSKASSASRSSAITRVDPVGEWSIGSVDPTFVPSVEISST